MTTRSTVHRMLAASLVAGLALGALAPAADAGHAYGKQRKWKRYEYGPPVVERVAYAPAPVVEVHGSSCGVPVLAGFIGGVALGAVLSSAAHPAPPPGYGPPPPAYCPPPAEYCPEPAAYAYWDPYCHARFASLDLYLAHLRHECGHPRIARVVNLSSGQCVAVLRWEDGQWEDADGDDD